jgi:hypothetical protein
VPVEILVDCASYLFRHRNAEASVPFEERIELVKANPEIHSAFSLHDYSLRLYTHSIKLYY